MGLVSLFGNIVICSLAFAKAEDVKTNTKLAQELLQASDIARGGVEDGVVWEAEVQNQEEGELTNRRFRIRAKGDNALVEALSPARNKGEVFLFQDRDMWFYKPGLKKPVAISARQKLTGQAANGDIASTHYARDYDAQIEKELVVNGQKQYVLLLKAKSKNLTYDQIRYWVSEPDRLAFKAEFLTLQGTVFKRADLEYKNSITYKGKKFPFVSQLKITDAKFEENFSILKYENPSIQNVSTNLFNINRLGK